MTAEQAIAMNKGPVQDARIYLGRSVEPVSVSRQYVRCRSPGAARVGQHKADIVGRVSEPVKAVHGLVEDSETVRVIGAPVSEDAGCETGSAVGCSKAPNGPTRCVDVDVNRLSAAKQVDVPIRLLAGSEDGIVDTNAHSVRLHRELRHSTLKVIPRCGHMVHHAAPNEVARAIVGVRQAVGQTRPACLGVPRHWLDIDGSTAVHGGSGGAAHLEVEGGLQPDLVMH